MFGNIKRLLVGMVAAGVLGLGAAAISSAASSTAPTPSTPPNSSARPALPAFHGPAPGTAAHEDAEKAVTGTAAAKARAAAIKALGGGTAGTVTTNYRGDGYEVTVTRSNGSKVEVHLDHAFRLMQGPPGPGGPPPRPGGAPAPPPPSGA